MSDLEGLGDAATGGVIGRAVEPRAGETADGHTHERNCLNCGCALVGEYCHCCGQHAHVHRTIGAWWHDFLHSVLHLDGKFLRTMPMLAWRPGELTRRYAHGERAKFISPLALFLFTVFLMFAVFSVAGADIGETLGVSQSIEEAATDEREALKRLSSERAEAARRGDTARAAEIDRRIAQTNEDLAQLDRLREDGVTSAILSEEASIEGGGTFDAAYRKAKQNPELLVYKVQANAYKFSWALIPISLPFVWVLFLHRRRYRDGLTLYDHLVFVTYSISFMSLWLVLYVLLQAAGLDGGPIDIAMLLIPPIHMYRQLKAAYRLSRFSALWRTFALLFFATIALSLFAMLLLMIGTGFV